MQKDKEEIKTERDDLEQQLNSLLSSNSDSNTLINELREKNRELETQLFENRKQL